ncbi:Ubiquitin Carboxyl-Terminal Hydrolase 15 [Manis pentadactyla]|nr:Ubiquitin Carboxyl-Terminal Hydrolase 15 [Manis pentadactyla]
MTLHPQVPPDAMQHDDDAQAGQELPTEGYDVNAGDGDANEDTDEDGGEVTTSYRGAAEWLAGNALEATAGRQGKQEKNDGAHTWGVINSGDLKGDLQGSSLTVKLDNKSTCVAKHPAPQQGPCMTPTTPGIILRVVRFGETGYRKESEIAIRPPVHQRWLHLHFATTMRIHRQTACHLQTSGVERRVNIPHGGKKTDWAVPARPPDRLHLSSAD